MMKIESWIDAFRRADGPPPEQLGGFLRWCLSGSWPALWLATFLSALAGAMEAGTAFVLGAIIDSTAAGPADAYFSGTNVALILGALAYANLFSLSPDSTLRNTALIRADNSFTEKGLVM